MAKGQYQNTQFYNTSSKQNLLNTVLQGPKIHGTSDVALVSNSSVKGRIVATGMIIGFELKKTIEDHNIYQAILQLLTGHPMSRYELTQLLTDLRDEWHFFWIENKDQVVSTTLLNRQEAINFLEMIVQETISPTEVWISLRILGEGRATMLNQGKGDVMSLLPAGDIANMEDVKEVMTPDEIWIFYHERLYSKTYGYNSHSARVRTPLRLQGIGERESEGKRERASRKSNM